jgi:hypothetical protein
VGANPGDLPALLKKSLSVTLDTNGNGTLYFDPDNANQRWEVTGVVCSTNQGLITPYPQVSLFVGPETSIANMQGQSSSGNRVTFAGCSNVGAADTMAVVWNGGVPGSVASAQLSGMKYTRTMAEQSPRAVGISPDGS